MKIFNHYSPNFNRKKRLARSIKFIVIHYTGMQSERESIKRLCNPKYKVSSHFLINQKGKVYRLVEDNRIAWHAGKSRWGKYKNLNKNSIGIELVNKGHRFGYTNFKKKQLSSLIKICNKLIFVSGQIAINPETNLFEGGTAGEQTERIFANLNAILKAAGSSFECVVKSTVYLADMNDFDAMNEVYAQHVGQPAPARTTIEISQLPAGALVEIDVIAYGRTKCTLGQFFFGRSR